MISVPQRHWAASLCRVTPLNTQLMLQSAPAGSMLTLSCWAAPVHREDTASPAMPHSLAGAGDVQASSEMCCLFFQIFHKTFSYFSGESKTSLDWKGLLQIICFHPPGLPVCAPAVSVGSKGDPAPFLVPRIHPPGAFWCDPATSLCLLVQCGQ